MNSKPRNLIEMGYVNPVMVKEAAKMFGQPFKLLISLFANTNWPEGVHNTTDMSAKEIYEMADVRSYQDRFNRYSALLKADYIRRVRRYEYMLNPNLFFVGDAKQKQEAIERYNKLKKQ